MTNTQRIKDMLALLEIMKADIQDIKAALEKAGYITNIETR